MSEKNSINIISTLGPSTESARKVRALFDAGCHWFRLNINHGSPEGHALAVEHVRKVAADTGSEANFFFDLGGPKVRIGDVSGEMRTDEHETYIFTKQETVTSRINNKIFIQEPGVVDVLEVGDIVTIGDSCITFEMINRINDDEIEAKVTRGGTLSSRRGIAVPGKFVPVPLLTERDREFVRLARKHLVWYFALSFVQRPEDVQEFRAFAKECGIPDPFIIAKIETTIGVENIEAIVAEADLVMIARGDLMIDTGIPAFGPTVETLTQKLKSLNVPFIVATELVSSMLTSSSPTRAEVMNVYQAKKDGAWGVMLSNETAMGDYPIECVQTVRSILDY